MGGHNLSIKTPRGWSWLTNPKLAAKTGGIHAPRSAFGIC